MRLVESSTPGAVERDQALHLLSERAVLTRAVCHELREDKGDSFATRPVSALYILCRWIEENCANGRYCSGYGDEFLDEMTVPADCEALLQEIRDGAAVANDLLMLQSADTEGDVRGDVARIKATLARYWAAHPVSVSTPRPNWPPA